MAGNNMMHSAILKALIQQTEGLQVTRFTHGFTEVNLTLGPDPENPEDSWYAELNFGGMKTCHDPIRKDTILCATGMSPGDAMSKLEILLQQWY